MRRISPALDERSARRSSSVGLALGVRPAGTEVVRRQAARDEQADERGVGADRRVERRRREVRRDHHVWATAVTPTITRKIPKTRNSRTGRGTRRGRPNMVIWLAPTRSDGLERYGAGSGVAHGTEVLPWVPSAAHRDARRDASGGGEGGIRTHEVFRLSAFQERRHQPLGHLSADRIQRPSASESRAAGASRQRATCRP